MLVLSRKRDQTVVIDGRIKVVIADVRGDLVRLGFVAPLDVRIDRGEVHDLRLAEAAEARRRREAEDREREEPADSH